MKQIENNTLCFYCLGCSKQECEEYKPVLRCKDFVAGIENWQDKLRKELKDEKESKNRII